MATATLQDAEFRVAHLSRCYPIDHAALNKALSNLRAIELTDPAYARKMLGWHRGMLAAYESDGHVTGIKEHREGIQECLAALASADRAAA